MVKCPHCSAMNVDDANYCFACGRRLLKPLASVPASHASERERLEFLLAEMSRWSQQGLISPSVSQVIAQPYRLRLQSLDQQQQVVELRELGATEERSQRFAAALATYSRALELFPNDVELNVTVRRLQELTQHGVENPLAEAMKLLNTGKFTEAEAHCSQFIQSSAGAGNPRLADAYDLRAQAREKLGRMNEALTDAERAKELSPNTIEYAMRVARLWRAIRSRQQAEAPASAPAPSAPAKPARDFGRVLEAFCEERNIFWWHIVSALLLVSGLIGLAWWQWSLLGGYILTASVLVTTAGLYHFGKSIHAKLPDTGRVLIVLSMIIAPLNVVIVKSHIGVKFDWRGVGLVTSFASCALYMAALRRWKFESLSYLVGAAALSTVHHVLRLCGVELEVEGLYFVPVALVMLVVAHQMRDCATPITKPFSVLAQLVVGLSLLSTLVSLHVFFTGPSKLHGAFLMLMSAVFCAAFSDLFKQCSATYAASIFVGIAALLFAMEFRIPIEQSAALAGLGVAVALTTMAKVYEETRRDTELARDISARYFVCGVTSSIGVVLVLLLQGLAWLINGGLPRDPASLARTLATVAMSAGFYAALARVYRKPFFTHAALALTSYAWFLASRWVPLAMARSPINAGLAFYPLTLVLAVFGLQQVRRARAAASVDASRALIPLMWAGVLAALSLGVQVFEQGVSIAIIASRMGQVAEFLCFNGSGGVSGIATFLLHAALFAFFAHEFGHRRSETASGGVGERETATAAGRAGEGETATTASATGRMEEKENGSHGSHLLQRVACVGAPWLAAATLACATIAIIQSLTLLHIAPAVGALIMIVASAGILALSIIAECARQLWWSRPMFGCASVVSLIFAFVPFLKPTVKDAWWTICAISCAVLVWSLISIPQSSLRCEAQDDNKPVDPFGDASPVFVWITVALECALAALFMASAPFTHLTLGSWHLTVYFAMCAACWIALAFSWKSTHLFVAGLVATTGATFEFVCAQLPIGQMRFGWYGLASVGYGFALLACACSMRRRDQPAFASCADAFAQMSGLAGFVIAVITYQQASSFRLPSPGAIDAVAVDRCLLVAVSGSCALLFALIYRVVRDVSLLRVACLCGTAAYAALIEFPFALPTLLPSLNNEVNFGLAFLPLVAGAMALAARLQRRKSPAATQMVEAAAVILLCCLVAQPYYIYSIGCTVTPVLTLLSASGLGVIGAVCMRCVWLVYPTSALAGWGVTQWLSNAGFDASHLAVNLVAFAGVMFVMSESVSRERVDDWRDAFANSAVAFAVAANVFAARWIAPSAEVSAIASALATVLLGALAVRRRSPLMADLGAGSLATVCINRMICGSGGWWMAAVPTSPIITALPAIVGAFVFLAVAFMLERKRLAVFSTLSLAAAWMTFAVTGFPKVASLTMFPVLATCGVGYGLFAHQRKSTLFGAIGAVTIAIAHSHGLASLSVPTMYFPLLFAPVVIALAIWPDEMPHLCKPFRATAGCVSALALIHAASVNDHSILLTALLLYGALYFADALRRQSEWQAVVAGCLLSGAWAHLLHSFFLLSPLQFPLYFAPLSLVWLAIAAFLAPDERTAQLVPVFVAFSAIIAGGVAALAVTGAGADRANGTYAVFALLVASLTFGLLCAFQRLTAFGHASFFCVLLAYYLPLFDHHIQAPDAYLIPVGLYLIALSLMQDRAARTSSQLSQRRIEDSDAIQPTSWGCDLGLFVVLGSSLWGSMTMAQNPWHDVVLTTDAVIAFAFGLARHRKTFTFQGAGALAMLGLIKSWGILVSIHWAIYATMLGLSGLLLGYYFSVKREELMALSRRVQAEMAAWR